MKEKIKDIFDTIMLIIFILFVFSICLGFIACVVLLINWIWTAPILTVLGNIFRFIIMMIIIGIILSIINKIVG